MNHHPLIERPEMQTAGQRTLYGALTLAFWAFWIYLWVPLLALLAWVLGVQQAFKYMVILGGYHHAANLLGIYALVILALGGTLVTWATYNILRFRGVERRLAPLPVSAAELMRHFGADGAALARWQSTQRLFVTHTQEGQIFRVDSMASQYAVA